MAKLLSEKDEQILLNAVDKVADLVDAGSTPSEAIANICKEGSINPWMAERLVTNYNAGIVLSDKDNDSMDTLSKLASFELADMDKVYDLAFTKKASLMPCTEIDALYSSTYKEAEVDEIDLLLEQLKQPVEKKASVSEDSIKALEEVFGVTEKKATAKPTFTRKYAKFEVEQAYADEYSHIDSVIFNYATDLNQELNKLAYLIDADHNNDLSDYYIAVRSKYGADGLRVLNTIGRIPSEVRTKSAALRSFKELTPVYASVGKVIELCNKIGEAKASRELLAKIEASDETFKEPRQGFTKLSQFGGKEKEAAPAPVKAPEFTGNTLSKIAISVNPLGLPGPVAVGKGIHQGFLDLDTLNNSRLSGKADDLMKVLDDPVHLNRLDTIRAKLALNELMNEDEVISGYDPEEVIEAFNDLTKTVPGITLKPEILRNQLRSRLGQGSLGLNELDIATKLNYGPKAYLK